MGHVLVIARREVSSLFVSLIGYVVLALFLLFMGIVFTVPMLRIFAQGEVIEMRRFTEFSQFALFFVVPMLTMSLFSDEYRSGRIEMLRTSPITEFHLLFGKFIGTMIFYVILIASTLLFLVILMAFGRPDFGQVLSCYLGLFLLGCMFVSVGLFFSSLTREPIVALLLSIITLAILTFPGYFLTPYMRADFQLWPLNLHVPLRSAVEYLSVSSHLGDFTRGSVELSSTMYFVGLTANFLFWTYLVLESKKWR